MTKKSYDDSTIDALFKDLTMREIKHIKERLKKIEGEKDYRNMGINEILERLEEYRDLDIPYQLPIGFANAIIWKLQCLISLYNERNLSNKIGQ